MVLKTTPRLDESTIPPTMRGVAPLTARFNLCESSDPEQNLENPEEGDSLNWQFHFGDSDTPPFAADGTFNPDAEHFCRTEHIYAEGTYTATVSVTDKHLEDQASDVSAAARVTREIRVEAVGEAEAVVLGPMCVAGSGDVIPAGGSHSLVITASSGSATVQFNMPPANVTATYTRLSPPQAPSAFVVSTGTNTTIFLSFGPSETWRIEFQDGGSPSGTPYTWLSCP
jgi:hypothetical protein